MKHHQSLLLLTSAACIGAAALFAASAAHALSPDWSSVDDARLENLFWDCDARSTQEVLSPGDGALCAMSHDEMMRRRFDGDFGRLHAWWSIHKAAEHARRGVPAPAPEPVDPDELALRTP